MKEKYKKPFIVAEIGNNHEGSFEIAKKLILKASDCGVDAVKFQTFIPEYYVNSSDLKRFKQLKKFALTKENFISLSRIAKSKKLKFISTPLDLESAFFLKKIVDYFKISSGDNKYYDLISTVLKFNKKTIISTGLLNLIELKKLYNFLLQERYNLKNISLLHCVASYPTDLKDINLERIKFIKNNFKVKPGFSDHTIGLTAPITAFFYGAEIIEKHFTLDNNFSNFRDHKLSLNPNDMTKLVSFFKDFDKINTALKKNMSAEEKKNVLKMRRGYYAKKDLEKNARLKLSDIKYVRPGGKNSINNLNEILNKKIKDNIKKDEPIVKKSFR